MVDGLITKKNLTTLLECGVMISEYDWVSPELLEGSIWSWDSSVSLAYIKNAYSKKVSCIDSEKRDCYSKILSEEVECPTFSVSGNDKRSFWKTTDCISNQRYLCRSKANPTRWILSNESGEWTFGYSVCRKFPGFDFLPPSNEYSNMKAREILYRHAPRDSVWIGL